MIKIIKKNNKKIILTIILFLMVLFYFIFHQNNNNRDFSPDTSLQIEINKLTGEISNIATIPTGETPTVITVSNPDLLKGQVFFDGAQKGDKVLVYKNAKRAILYVKRFVV